MDQIRSRAEIARDAETAAERFVATGIEQPNPYIGEAGEADWQAAFSRYVHERTAAEGSEGSA